MIGLPTYLKVTECSVALLPSGPSQIGMGLLSVLKSCASGSFKGTASKMLAGFGLPMPRVAGLVIATSFIFDSFMLVSRLVMGSPAPPRGLTNLPSNGTFALVIDLKIAVFFFASA